MEENVLGQIFNFSCHLFILLYSLLDCPDDDYTQRLLDNDQYDRIQDFPAFFMGETAIV